MAALDELGLTNDTLVVLTGDHGWQLGEHSEWGKHTNFELAVHVPLLVRAPWKPAAAGRHTQSFVELLDLYKSLADTAGLPLGDVEADVDGDSFAALLDDPSKTAKTAVYSQYSRCPGNRYWPKHIAGPDYVMNNCETVPAANISYMGYTVRTPDWRYTEWFAWDGSTCQARFDSPSHGVELYSHKGQAPYPVDFDNYENVNVAADPSNAGVVQSLRAMLLARFRPTAPTSCPPPLAPASQVTPLPGFGLMQERSDVQNDTCLCSCLECLQAKNPEKNYTQLGYEGYMPAEDSAATTPLFQYWSSENHDNVLVTGRITLPSSYKALYGHTPAGRVLAAKPTGLDSAQTVALQLFWSAAEKDHLTAAEGGKVAAWAVANHYTLLDTIGYVYTDPQFEAALELF